MLVSIDRLKPDSTPVRRRLWEADDASLRASSAELGVLEPLLVVRLGDDMDEAPDFEVKDGNRRLAAARACGLLALEVAELPRKREDYTLAAATAAKRDLPGNLPGGWMPDYAQFGAPGPKPAKEG